MLPLDKERLVNILYYHQHRQALKEIYSGKYLLIKDSSSTRKLLFLAGCLLKWFKNV